MNRTLGKGYEIVCHRKSEKNLIFFTQTNLRFDATCFVCAIEMGFTDRFNYLLQVLFHFIFYNSYIFFLVTKRHQAR